MSARRAGGATRPGRLAEILRVDQAGELGAVRIYQGQLAVLGRAPNARRSARLIAHMGEQEERHKAELDALMTEHRARPTLLSPFWSAAGVALGAATALLGEKAAMACTVAVETVIDKHYAAQIEELANEAPAIAGKLSELRADEIEHRDTGLAEGAQTAPGYPVLTGLIKAGCRLAIRIAEKV